MSPILPNHLLSTIIYLTLLLTSSSPSPSLAAPAPVPAAATAEPSTPDVTKLFNGLGHIFVLNATSYSDASLSDTIGCLSDTGYVVSPFSSFSGSEPESESENFKSNCAVFSTTTSYPKTINSRIGGCSFGNQAMPTNEDSRYGARQHAWSCNEDAEMVPEGERYYTINGFKHPFICNGNLNCYYDIPRAPLPAPPSSLSSKEDSKDTTKKDKVFVWQYAWGSEQMGITPGHLQVLWMWVPVGTKAE